MISARILADSVNPFGNRLTSFLVTYPRFIHSEVMTHRGFSRNAASSRARPMSKTLEGIIKNPALPEKWGAEQKGMQSGGQLEQPHLGRVRAIWEDALRLAHVKAEQLHEQGLHKSLCNRIIEPFDHITVLITAADWCYSNFFALRAHQDAMPEFQVLAFRMLNLYLAGEPNKLAWKEWHIPHFEGATRPQLLIGTWENDVKVATARCARLSYLTHEGEHSREKDLELHDRLLASGHMSPFEHCAKAEKENRVSNFDWFEMGAAHLSGWQQYRKMIIGECQSDAPLPAILANKPEWITL